MSLQPVRFPRLRWHPVSNQRGLTLLEVMIAALVLLFVLLSMVSGYMLGRVNLDREEVKRRAIGLAQDRLETVRARSIASVAAWELVVPARIDTTYVLDGTTFRLTSTVDDSLPTTPTTKPVRKTVTVNVGWTIIKKDASTVARSIRSSTVMSKDVTPNS